MEDMGKTRHVDLSHVIEEGMTTYKGLPGPHICDFWERTSTAANYDDGSTFQIGRIDMIANTGTYLDAPFHRYAEGADLAELPLQSLADLPAIVVRRIARIRRTALRRAADIRLTSGGVRRAPTTRSTRAESRRCADRSGRRRDRFRAQARRSPATGGWAAAAGTRARCRARARRS